MNKSIMLHKEKMEQLRKEIEDAKGYRKKDLLRQYRRMSKELSECMMYLKG